MDWKQIVVNTVTALLVAVSSGVLVWVLTKAPDHKEGLTYSLERAGGFGSGENRLTFYSLELRNRGSAKAEKVDIEVETVGSGSLNEIEAQFKTPAPSGVTFKRFNRNLIIQVPSFLSADFGRIALLYYGNVSYPQVRVRSADGIGQRDEKSQQPFSTNQKRVRLFLGLIAFTLYILFVRQISRWFLKRVDFRFLRSDRNNSGFLLLHSGLTKEAHDILLEAVKAGRHDPITLSNFGAVKACLGDVDQAHSLIRTAGQWARDKRSRAIVRFNYFITLYVAGDTVRAKDVLLKAFAIDEEIRMYCLNSKIISDLSNKDKELKDVISSSGK